MHRLAVLAMLVGCGRVGFDTRRIVEAGAGDGPPGDGGVGDGCTYLTTCGAPNITCCTGAQRTCELAGSCTGQVSECNPNPPFQGCTTGQACCLGDAGLTCFGPFPPPPC